LQEIILGHEWRQWTKGISNPFMRQGDRGLGENTFRRRKTGGRIGDTDSWGVESTQESKDSIEESWNRRWGDLESPHGCSWEDESEKSEGVRKGWVLFGYMNPWKPNSLVYETGQSSFVWTDKNSPKRTQPFQDILRAKIILKHEMKTQFKDVAHLDWEILIKTVLNWIIKRNSHKLP
jgi:hypothetical protein